MLRSAKQRSAQQEDVVMEAAVKCIEESSLLDFTMAAIGKEAGLSIGSIYKHVQSKEDVLVALSTRVSDNKKRIFAEVMEFPLTMPERLIAIMLLSPQKLALFSFGTHLQMLTSNEAVLQRASKGWIEKLARVEREIGEVFRDAVMDAWQSGEFIIDGEERVASIETMSRGLMETMSVGLWSMYVGFVQVAYQRKAFDVAYGESELPFPVMPDHALIRSAQRQINSFSWKVPLDDRGIAKATALLEVKGHR